MSRMNGNKRESGVNTKKEEILKRSVEVGTYFVENKSTVRDTAKKFGVSKTTIHRDLTDNLLVADPTLAAKARYWLHVNSIERSKRGGTATKKKYDALRKRKRFLSVRATRL